MKCWITDSAALLPPLQEGLRTLQRDGNVLKCHSNHWDAKWYAELGASKAILEAGHNLDSLMQR